MAAKEVHKEHIREHQQVLADAMAIGIEQRPATIGLHTSACSIELLELYLHVLDKIPAGAMIKHEWFKAPKPGQKIEPLAERKLGVVFPHKEKILELLYLIEEERNKLIYGKPRLPTIEAVLNAFKQLHALIKDELKTQGEDIE